MDSQNTSALSNLSSAVPNSSPAPREPTPEEVKEMQEYAVRWRKRYPKKNAAQMAKAIMKKFGVQLT